MSLKGFEGPGKTPLLALEVSVVSTAGGKEADSHRVLLPSCFGWEQLICTMQQEGSAGQSPDPKPARAGAVILLELFAPLGAGQIPHHKYS
jgi:hypothetical protein